ncbi:hypothetical protein AeRB84_011772, partial [Aphanomyces euteiches]
MADDSRVVRVPLKSYGSDDNDALLSPRRRHSRWLWIIGIIFLVMNVIVLICIAIVGKTVSESLDRVTIVQTVQALSAYNLPSKFAVQYVTPRQDQAHRGTCWDFATISLLEWSYRANGVRNGWLTDDEYVAFSEQANGIEVVRLCTGAENSPQQKACRVAGGLVWNGSAEGGETYDLYYLKNGLKNSVLPTAVCPYYTSGNESVCPGLDDALKKNPVRFDVKDMGAFYDDPTIKLNLFTRNVAMTLGTPVVSAAHYYPCIGPFVDSIHCQPATCTLCPAELSQTTCCVPTDERHNPNMEGEFYGHSGLALVGGHGMLLGAYNDAFRNHEGEVGGFILKNSWADSQTRGSHTLKWWLQDISDWEERTICPNSYNPTNWYACGGKDDISDLVSPTNDTTPVSFNNGIQDCLSDTTRLFAKTNVQTLELVCADKTHCKVDPDVTYFVRNTTDWGDRMTLMCVWESNPKVGSARDFCLLPMLEQGLAATFKPKVALPNDPDRCGF